MIVVDESEEIKASGMPSKQFGLDSGALEKRKDKAHIMKSYTWDSPKSLKRGGKAILYGDHCIIIAKSSKKLRRFQELEISI